MDTKDALSELKDVHLPSPNSIFPLAIGWYFVICLIIISLTFIVLLLFKKRKKLKQLKEIEELFFSIKTNLINDDEIIAQSSILLKRIAILRFPEDKPQLLFGSEWLNFLDKTGKTTNFTNGDGKYLGDIYNHQTLENKEQFFSVINQWIKVVL